MQRKTIIILFIVLFSFSTISLSSAQIQSPSDYVGFTIGADYKLVDYNQIVDYLKYLQENSDRLKLYNLGETTMENRFYMAAISSADNLKNLDRYRDIQNKLSDPRKITDVESKSLIQQGKTVVLLNCAIHSTEIGSTQMAPLLAHYLVTSDDPEIQQIRQNVIVLLLPAHNPDGQLMVTEWYRQHVNGPYNDAPMPYLYHKYVGHDNNRDWFMFTQKETQITVEKIHNVWHPQIVHDLHQMGSRGARIFLPPYIDPVEPNVDPILVSNLNMLGETMSAALIRTGKTGVVTNAIYDAWTPARAYQHYHGGVRILTEVASANIASPVAIPFSSLYSRENFDTKKRSVHFPKPWTGGTWRLQDIIDYEWIATLAELEHAAKFRKDWLESFYNIQKDAVEYSGHPWGYLIPDDPEKQTEIKELLEVLQTGGVEIYRIEDQESTNGIVFQKGDYVIPLAQPYGPFARTLLEKRDYPQIMGSDGNLRRPYDMVAHNLPLLLYVDLDTLDQAPPSISSKPVNFQANVNNVSKIHSQYLIISPNSYGADLVALRLSQGGVNVFRLQQAVQMGQKQFSAGTYVLQNSNSNRSKLTELAPNFPVNVQGIDSFGKKQDVFRLRSVHFGIYHSYVPSIDEGWTRWIFDHYKIAFQSMKNKDIQNLSDTSPQQVLIFTDQSPQTILQGFTHDNTPPEYRGGIEDKGMEALRKFVENGGTIISWGKASQAFIDGFWLNVSDAVADLPPNKFYIPGSILGVEVNNIHPLCYGLSSPSSVLFRSGQVFEVAQGNVVAKYSHKDPLQTGWITGPEYIEDKPAVVQIPYGKGQLIFFGFQPQFRAQARGSFKFMFNAILLGAATKDTL